MRFVQSIKAYFIVMITIIIINCVLQMTSLLCRFSGVVFTVSNVSVV
jgi:hypothetical protein